MNDNRLNWTHRVWRETGSKDQVEPRKGNNWLYICGRVLGEWVLPSRRVKRGAEVGKGIKSELRGVGPI